MEKLDSFSSLEGAAVEPQVDPKKAERQQRIAEMTQALKETVNTDPNYLAQLGRLSKSVQVVNTLGFGDSGNIIVDPASKGKPKEERELQGTSRIVGYRIANIGTEDIAYSTEEYTLEGDVYVGKRVQKTLAVGKTANLTRKAMTAFCAQPAISFQLANGKIVRGSGTVRKDDIEGELEAYYFSFDDKNIKVNSDDVKINVAAKKKVGDKDVWLVKKEFLPEFGYLNNPKTPGKRGRGPSNAQKFTAQDAAANYVNRLLAGQL